MRRKRFLGFLSAFALLALPLGVYGQGKSLKVGSATEEFSATVSVPLSLTSDEQVQGLVAAVDWDSSLATGVEIALAAPFDGLDEADADTVVTRIEAGFAVIGVVMDSDPADNGGVQEVLDAGADIAIADIVLELGTTAGSGPIAFNDGTYAAAEGGPALDNVVVVGGLSIGQVEGLALEGGTLTVTSALDRLIVESGGNGSTAQGDIRILMNNNDPVEGFVTVVCHDPAALTLNEVVIGADAAQADFTASEIEATGGSFGVVIDLEDPTASPPNIMPAKGNHVATYRYTCVSTPAPGEDDIVTPLTLCDGAIGSPLKENLIVVGGLSIGAPDLVLQDGTFTCGPTGPAPTRETDCSDGIDNDADGLTDLDDPDCQVFDFEVLEEDENGDLVPAVLEGPPATETDPVSVEGMLYLNPPTKAALGLTVDPNDDAFDPGAAGGNSPFVSVQGFSLGYSYMCSQVAAIEDFDISGTILDSVGAEFVGIQADNDAEDVDGDGCSMVLGVLLDAVPPFDGQVIPAVEGPLALGLLKFGILDVACGESAIVEGQNGVSGRGNTPVFNLVSVSDEAFPATVRPIEIKREQAERFYRGDCNFSLRAGDRPGASLVDPVEIADAAAVVSFLFQKSIFKFEPPCLDACDANDDGRIDLADAVGILYFLFVPGTEVLPAPGPGFDEMWGRIGPGVDKTPDPLDCADGSDCAIGA